MTKRSLHAELLAATLDWLRPIDRYRDALINTRDKYEPKFPEHAPAMTKAVRALANELLEE